MHLVQSQDVPSSRQLLTTDWHPIQFHCVMADTDDAPAPTDDSPQMTAQLPRMAPLVPLDDGRDPRIDDGRGATPTVAGPAPGEIPSWSRPGTANNSLHGPGPEPGEIPSWSRPGTADRSMQPGPAPTEANVPVTLKSPHAKTAAQIIADSRIQMRSSAWALSIIRRFVRVILILKRGNTRRLQERRDEETCPGNLVANLPSAASRLAFLRGHAKVAEAERQEWIQIKAAEYVSVGFKEEESLAMARHETMDRPVTVTSLLLSLCSGGDGSFGEADDVKLLNAISAWPPDAGNQEQYTKHLKMKKDNTASKLVADLEALSGSPRGGPRPGADGLPTGFVWVQAGSEERPEEVRAVLPDRVRTRAAS